MQRTMLRLVLVALTSGALWIATGCGDDDGEPGPDAQVAFEVTAVEPVDGTEEAYLDQTVRVSFSRPLDRASLDATAVQVLADGVPAVGRLLPERQAVRFVPWELQSDTEYTVRVSAEVRDASGEPLGEEFTSTFVTGAVTGDGAPPFDAAANAPFDGQRYVNVTRQVEYVLGGMEYVLDSVKTLYVVDPIDYDPLEPAVEDLWSVANAELGVDGFRYGAAGNLDDDPEEEVIALLVPFGGTPSFFRLEPDGEQMVLETLDATIDFGGDLSDSSAVDLALGDVDGDGYDEIVVTAVDYLAKQGRLFVFDDKLAGHARLKEMELPGLFVEGAWTGVELARVEVGNVDDDPEQEIVLALAPDFCSHNITLLQLDSLDQSYEELIRYETEHSPCGFYFTGLALADLDGTPPAEIVIANRNVGTMGGDECHAWIYVSSFASRDATLVELSRTAPEDAEHLVGNDPAGCTHQYRSRVALHALEADGDPQDELLVAGLLFQRDAGSDAIVPMGFNSQLYQGGDDHVVAVAVGDVDGDGQDDVITVSREARIRAWALARILIGYDPDMQPLYEDTWRVADEHWAEGPPGQDRPLLVAANLDRDSVVVQPVYEDPATQTVAHHRVAGVDQIVAAVAAPPCYDEPWQRWESCRTGMGRSVEDTVSAGTELRIQTGVAIGVDPVLGAALVGERVSKAFARRVLLELRQTGDASPSKSVTLPIVDGAGLGEDLVVFYWVDHHQYRYSVVSHPDPDMIGTELSANVPMTPRVHALSRSSYNLSNGDNADIGPELLGHEGGEPMTYLGLGSLPHILGQHSSLGFTAPAVQVPEGSGVSDVVLAFGGEGVDEDGILLPTQGLLSVCDRGLCAGVQLTDLAPVYALASFDVHTAVLSTVGAIDPAEWEAHAYEYGVYGFVTFGEDIDYPALGRFVIVNYYVD